MRYEIRLINCAFFARHGVHDEEERMGQRFYVDVTMSVDAGDALSSDSIEGTVDYGVAFSLVEEIVTGRRRKLIESLALEVGNALLGRFPQVARATVTVRKPNAPVSGVLDYAEVSIACDR